MDYGSVSDDFIVTKSSLVKKNSVENFECVIYESHKSKQRSTKDTVGNEVDGKSKNDLFDIKKTHHEVLKFAIKGMNPEEKRVAKTNLAIKLGARAPRREYINYKTLKIQKEIEKEEQKNIAPDDFLAEVVKRKKKPRKKESHRGKPMRNILEGYGKPGQVKRKKKKKKK